MIAASDRFGNEELRFRFKRGCGFIGLTWENGENDVWYPFEMSPDEWNCDDLTREQRTIVPDLVYVITIPLFANHDGLRTLHAILAVDHPMPRGADPNFEQTLYASLVRVYKIAQGIETLLADVRDPLPYYVYAALRTTAGVARLLPLPIIGDSVYVRSAIFYQRKDVAYAIAASQGFSGSELELDFATEQPGRQGLVGQITLERVPFFEDIAEDDREERREALKKAFGMTDTQASEVLSIRSIAGFPIFDESRTAVIGVLTISSRQRLDQSRLHHPSVIGDALRLTSLAGKLLWSHYMHRTSADA